MAYSSAKISVGIFEPVSELTGGRAYREAVRRALEKTCDVEVLNISPKGFMLPARLRRFLALSSTKKKKDVWIRDFYSIAGMSLKNSGGKNIALFLHMYEGEESDLLGRMVNRMFVKNLQRCQSVVVIAEYWRQEILKLDIKNVKVISYGLEPSEFDFAPAEVDAFKRKYNLSERLIYIGNCRKSKGVVDVYHALKDTEYELVTSGEPDVSLPCRNLNLPYREYLLLLKSSLASVAMSQFPEGWCITAQEAMLCGTPVIGSGAGGMGELLRGGNQIVCQNPVELPTLIERAVNQRRKLGQEGFSFASRLTREKFEQAWLGLIEEVAHDTHRST